MGEINRVTKAIDCLINLSQNHLLRDVAVQGEGDVVPEVLIRLIIVEDGEGLRLVLDT